MSQSYKELRSRLQKNGYAHQWKLIKQKDIVQQTESISHQHHSDFYDKIAKQTTKPISRNFDLIIPSKERTQSQQIQLDQFMAIIGRELHEQVSCFYGPSHHDSQPDMTDTGVAAKTELDDEKRQFRIQEFIKTEKSYVDTLETIVKHVVIPLRATMQQKNSILNTFKCQKIFLNIDQIMKVNRDFLIDLTSTQGGFGDKCQKHIVKFECYRKYLLEQSEAQKLHAKEFKTNPNYKRFLTKVKDHSDFKRKRLQDILVEPVQRISRYSMMLREILQLTPKDHVDYTGLKLACEKAREIATMADDDRTKTATMFLNLYQAIKDSPCSLINQKRSLVAHLDAVEIHRVTNKPSRAVSLFLFTDKVLVASRSSTDAKEIDLQQLLDNTQGVCPTSSHSASLLRNGSHHKAEKPHLKFKGWADVESIEMFEGVPDRPNSFILSATNVPQINRDQVSSITSFEKYFYKGPRLFAIIPSPSKKSDSIEKLAKFKTIYQETRALEKRYEPSDRTYHTLWKGMPCFCSTYSLESYSKAKYKNDTVLVYVDAEDKIELQSLLPSRSTLFSPWVVGLVQPQDMKGFRFNIYAKTHLLGAQHLQQSVKQSEPTIDFESIFWNNNKCLKKSVDYSAQTLLKIQQGISTPQPTRSRSRSMSRTSSIPSLGKLFHGNSSSSRSRSVSPSKMIKKSKSTSSPNNGQHAISRIPVHHSWSGAGCYKHDHHNTSTSSITTLASHSSSLWQPVDHKEEEKNLMQSNAEDGKRIIDNNSNTISSLKSDSSGASSFSMMDDFAEEEGEEVDYLTLDFKNKPVSVTSFKSITDFEDEMQQQWKELVTKYDLFGDEISV